MEGRIERNQSTSGSAGNSQSFLLSPELGQAAIDLVIPTILAMMDGGITNRSCLHIVVLDPLAVADGQEVILAERSLGHGDWTMPFDKFARGKARASLRSGLSSRVMQQTAPYMYVKGDVPFAGAYVFEQFLIVGVSGVQNWYDEMIAVMVAAAIKAVCIAAFNDKSNGIVQPMDFKVDFLGE